MGNISRIAMLLLVALGFAGPARADITGRYRHVEQDATVTIEVAANGNARFEMSGEAWRLIHREGVSYVVYALPGGPLVARVEDLQRLALDRGGELPRLAISEMSVVDGGETRIGAYSGHAFHLRTPAGVAPRPQFVISSDPALAALGPAWLRQIDFSIAMLRARRTAVPATILRVREILATGTPVLYGGQLLQRVDHDAIPEDRFRLPGEPLTLDQLRGGAAAALLGPTV